jgi:hypothetical protein
MMSTTTVTIKGQVTIPLALRKALGGHAGHRTARQQRSAQGPVRRSGAQAREPGRHGSSHCTTGISVVVLVELCWVLQSLYRVTPSELLDLIDDLLHSRHLQLEHRPAVQAAVRPRSAVSLPAVDRQQKPMSAMATSRLGPQRQGLWVAASPKSARPKALGGLKPAPFL